MAKLTYKQMHRYKKVEVEWEDACHYGRENDREWIKKNTHLQTVKTIGYLVQKGRKIIKISSEILEDGDLRDTNVIPRSNVKHITYLGYEDVA